METPVIDFHGHVGRWSTNSSDDDPELYLRMMDAAGVDKACINCIFHSDARRGNDIVADYVGRHPERFIGVAFVTPHYPEEAIGELERAFGSGKAAVVNVIVEPTAGAASAAWRGSRME